MTPHRFVPSLFWWYAGTQEHKPPLTEGNPAITYLTTTPNKAGTTLTTLTKGDILASNAGWNCSFVKFMVVTAVSAKSVWLHPVERVFVDGDYANYTAAPSAENYQAIVVAAELNPKAMKTESIRKNLFYRNRAGDTVAYSGISDGLSYFTPWNGTPIRGNCD